MEMTMTSYHPHTEIDEYVAEHGYERTKADLQAEIDLHQKRYAENPAATYGIAKGQLRLRTRQMAYLTRTYNA